MSDSDYISSDTPQPRNSLAWKLADIQGRLHALRADATVDAGKYSYSYISESALLTAVRPLLAEHHIAVLVSVEKQDSERYVVEKSGNNGRYEQVTWASTVEVKVSFVDGESREVFEVYGQGSAQDAGDKSVYKAITSACRYIWWKTFLVPTDDDDVNQSDNKARSNVVDLNTPLEALSSLVSLCEQLEVELPKVLDAGPDKSWYALAKRAAWRDYEKPLSELTQAEAEELHEKMAGQLPEFQPMAAPDDTGGAY